MSTASTTSTMSAITTKVIAHQNENTNCTSNDSSTNLYTNINSHATTTTNAIESPIISSTSRIKPKSSSFLHRDYNRKPILARSQVSKTWRTMSGGRSNNRSEFDAMAIATAVVKSPSKASYCLRLHQFFLLPWLVSWSFSIFFYTFLLILLVMKIFAFSFS